MNGDIVITLDAVSARYGRQKALEGVTGHFHAGSLTAVAGPNGAGKSTLLKIVAGLVRPSSGRVLFGPGVQKKIGYLPQKEATTHDFPLSVREAVSTGLWGELGDVRALSSAQQDRISAALDQVGLEEMATRFIGALSGGQFQRMLFARLVVQDPDVLLLDEPFSGVDAQTTRRLMKLLLDWHRAGKTIICVLHDLLLIHKYFPESFVLSGKCLGRGHTHEMFEQKLLSFDLDMAELAAPGEEMRCEC